ncbi:MAG: hypothetical protein ACKPEA_03485, partial [Planctomycetota bacterium]
MNSLKLSVLSLLALVAPCHAQNAPADAAQPDAVTRFDGEVVVRAMLRSAGDLMLMGQLSDDPWSHSVGVGAESDWRLSRDRLPALRSAGVPFKVLIPDLQALVQAERDRLAQPQEAADWFADF